MHVRRLELVAILCMLVSALGTLYLHFSMQESYPRSVGAPENVRVMHQMHASIEALSPLERRLSDGCRTINEDRLWTYIFWNDSDIDVFVRTLHPKVYPWWHGMKPVIKKIDTSRYLLMHTYGGAYMDVDVECITPLEPIFADLPRNVAWFGGYPEPMQLLSTGTNNPFWLFMVSQIKKTLHVSDAWTTSGPAGLNSALNNYLHNSQKQADLLVPFVTTNTDPEWISFIGDANLSAPWFELPNHKMDDWNGVIAIGSVGFLPNQLVDPGACEGSKLCVNDTCAPLWPKALYAHHCIGSWRGRIDT